MNLRSDSARCGVTSFVDFYGFQRKGDRTVEELEEQLAQRIGKELGHARNPETALPYVQRHEFEGLLFSDVTAFAIAINAPGDSVEKLRNIREGLPTPGTSLQQ